MIEFLKKVQSKTDDVTKYAFKVDDQVVEASFIDKHDGKHIICMPSQTRCAMGCKFCQMTELGGPAKNITAEDLFCIVQQVLCSQAARKAAGTLLVSFMGGGEPVMNRGMVVESMARIEDLYEHLYKTVRFAVASIAPNIPIVEDFAERVRLAAVNCKFHLSLHSIDNEARKRLMPATITPSTSIHAASAYQRITNNQVEVHYTLIEGVNDSLGEAVELAEALRGRNWVVKFIDFNPVAFCKSTGYQHIVEDFIGVLHQYGIKTEFYTPPGRDIGASCGQFLLEDYKL